jgi:hypothetical protein
MPDGIGSVDGRWMPTTGFAEAGALQMAAPLLAFGLKPSTSSRRRLPAALRSEPADDGASYGPPRRQWSPQFHPAPTVHTRDVPAVRREFGGRTGGCRRGRQ